MSQNNQRIQTKDLTLIALFAAMTFIGTQVLKIQIMPPPAGFFHFGNVFLILSALLLGGKKGAVASCIGFTLFDLLNDYAPMIPKIVLISIIKCLIISFVFNSLKTKLSQTFAIVIACALSFIFGIAVDYVYYVAESMLLGNVFKAALISGFQGVIPTIVNAIIATAIVPVLYPIFKKIMAK